MTRHIVLGNGSLLVNIDKWLQLRDLYYPHVGEENHVLGHAHRIGIFADSRIVWLNDDAWHKKLSYMKNTLVSDCSAKNEDMKIELKINDCVDCLKNVFLKKITIKNNDPNSRKIKIFFHHDFHLYSDGIGDTAAYNPINNVIFHYKRRRFFMINAAIFESKFKDGKGDILDYTVGVGDKQTLEDANDGILSKNPIAQGQVDSIFSVEIDIEANSEKTVYYWICCGKNFDESDALNKFVISTTPEQLFIETKMCWEGLVNKCKINFANLPENIINEFKKSILIIRTQIDNRGGIVAANDSDNMRFNRDTYSYIWPRDGALVALALQRAGYTELVDNFYTFCKEAISRFGCFLHKYNPDGSLGSSWHPWIKNGLPHLPIQEDETALVIHSLRDYYERTKDKKFLKELYAPLVKKAADFMVSFIDEKTGLPKECFDLWEEREGIFTFTCSTVYAGLIAASKFAEEFGSEHDSKLYHKTAQSIKESILKFLFDEKEQRFLRGIKINGGIHKDIAMDSSIYGLFEFGVLDAEDERVSKTMNQIIERLWIGNGIGGMARYEMDNYHRIHDRHYPGNPWIICTAWVGKYYVETANTREELSKAFEIMQWIVSKSLSTGMMPEQLHPFTGEPLSVSPLTWSHSEFVDLVVRYCEKWNGLGG